nr:F-box domain, leucine-rich repeat domain, L domain-like protein [Tanacetum cinerariifolium]
MESPDWTEINAGILGTYNVEKIRREHPKNITVSEWDKYIEIWNDPRNIARAAQNWQNQAKSTVISRQGSRCRPQPLRSNRHSLTHSSWHTLLTRNSFGMRTDEEIRMLEAMGTYTYDEINRLARGGKQRGHVADVGRVLPARATASPRGDEEATGTYTDDEINRLARWGKQRWHIPGVGRVLPARATATPSTPAHESTLNSLHKKVDFMMSLFKSDSKYSDMFSQFESGGASGSGGCGDDEESADDQGDEDGDGDS